MTIRLGANRYGKAETRVVTVRRTPGRHELTDLNVSIALSGDLADTHLSGDNANVLPTDSQRNTVYAFAKRHGIDAPESFALLLARHFVAAQPAITHARVAIEQYPWKPLADTGHSFERAGGEVRTFVVHHEAAPAGAGGTGTAAPAGAGGTGTATHVVSGVTDLVVLNTTGSEFWGFATDEYTTLPPTRDRILATAVTAAWRHDPAPGDVDWSASFAEARTRLTEAFADTHSLSLQQTLYAMGSRVLERCPRLCEVRLSLPNKHHFLVDLSPFGLVNGNEVFIAADRPYGLIEGSVLRDGAPDPGPAWE